MNIPADQEVNRLSVVTYQRYINHDLLHVLAQVCSLSYLIDKELNALLHPKLTMYNQMLAQIAEQGLSMTRELLEASAGEASADARIPSLCDFLGTLEQMYQIQATQHRIRFEVTKPQSDQFVRICYSDLKRILDNLITNAFKFTPAGGQVSECASLKEKTLIIQVQDSSIGMSESMRQSVYVASPTGGELGRVGLRGEPSYGLGLAAVRQLVRKHQGTICCYPASPGTVFSVELPQLLDEPNNVIYLFSIHLTHYQL